MNFIDEVRIYVKAGDGGNGCVAFRREKFVPRGGPSGGDGGRGGDVTLVANPHYSTLLHLRLNPEHKAQRGRHGEGSQRTGKAGKSVKIPVPVGTVVYDDDSGEIIHDFAKPRERFVVAHGGHGGLGNQNFATATRQAPDFATPGKAGEEFNLRLELKLLADVGLVGFPNAGKSTFISRISAAKPKIADYPFTTLAPNLGMVQTSDFRTYVVADIPGLIEGASEGHGLGIRFLKHVERTKLLLHLVDISGHSGRSAVNDFDVVMRELENFSPEMLEKPMLVLGTKLDSMVEPDELEALRAHVTAKGFEFFAISSLASRGMKELLHRVEAMVLKPLDPNATMDEEEAEAPEALDEYGAPPHLTDEEEQLPGNE
ncbi:MAG: GTPase ObgE [Bryobacterales bacterium]|nr:GTPase ObgE [Bryobacterales bacterium]